MAADPVVTALDSLLRALEAVSGVTSNLTGAAKALGRRDEELSEDVAGLSNRIDSLAATLHARLTSLEQDVTDLNARLTAVHEKALRELTRIHEGDRPA